MAETSSQRSALSGLRDWFCRTFHHPGWPTHDYQTCADCGRKLPLKVKLLAGKRNGHERPC